MKRCYRWELCLVFRRVLELCDRCSSRLCGHAILGKIFLSSWIFLILPFGIYGWQRLTGIVPDQGEWFKLGILGPNHGPWHLQLENLFVMYPFLFLAPFTVFVGFVLAIYQRRVLLLVHGLWIAVLLLAMAHFQLKYLGWLID